MAVAVNAPLTLSKADLSEVAQTTTDFFIPSGPKSFSINSRTSRPLSPIRHITLTSASASLAIIPNVVLLPTPEPAKIPILCPSPQVKKPSMALTPVGSISFILFLFNGSGGWFSKGYGVPVKSSPPYIGLPKPSNTIPIKSSEHCTSRGLLSGTTIHPGDIPTSSPKGINMTLLFLNPTTSQLTGLL